MRLKVLAVAGIIGLGAGAVASAQTLNGPRELPPPSYKGQQYIDSAGCVFLRAGINGRVTWVARVDRNRRQLCGYPSSGRATVAAAPEAEEPAPAPARVPVTTAPAPADEAVGKPMETVASIATPARPVAPAAPVAETPVYAPPAAPEPAEVADAGTPGCPPNAPAGVRRVLPDGRMALLCSRDAASLAAYVARVTAAPEQSTAPEVTQVATAPMSMPAEAPVAGTLPTGASSYAGAGGLICPPAAPVARAFPLRGGGVTVLCTSDAGSLESAVAAIAPNRQPYVPVLPRGYVAAWKDDRLNPLRGAGTAAGQVAQDQIWTRKVPAKLVTNTGKPHKRVVVVATNNTPAGTVRRVTTSTATAPAAAVTGGTARRLYVQVGSFAVPANAEGARSRLSGMGLPVSGGRGAIKGKAVQVVYAGPFATAAEAQAALGAARRAGFGDAFIR